jgi:hypothetical protein
MGPKGFWFVTSGSAFDGSCGIRNAAPDGSGDIGPSLWNGMHGDVAGSNAAGASACAGGPACRWSVTARRRNSGGASAVTGGIAGGRPDHAAHGFGATDGPAAVAAACGRCWCRSTGVTAGSS